jgi:hypothetical protein
MTKRLALFGLLVALGAGLAVYLVLPSNGSSGGPATYARLQPAHGPSALEVWRDTTQRLTFRWLGDRPGEVDRYDPSTLALAEFSDGQALGSTTYTSSRAAWSHIHALYGVTESQVTSALASGTRSAEPPAYQVNAPQHKNSNTYSGFTDYGTNVGKMANATGLVVPRLKSLDGYPLMDAAVGPEGLAGLAYGPHPLGNGVITVNFAEYRPAHRQAAGTVYKTMFNSPRWPHHTGPVPYSETDGGDIIFPYRSEWAGVTTLQGTQARKAGQRSSTRSSPPRPAEIRVLSRPYFSGVIPEHWPRRRAS